MWVLKTYAFCKGQNSPQKSFYMVFGSPLELAYKKQGAKSPPNSIGNIYIYILILNKSTLQSSDNTGGAPMHRRAAHCNLLRPKDRRFRMAPNDGAVVCTPVKCSWLLWGKLFFFGLGFK